MALPMRCLPPMAKPLLPILEQATAYIAANDGPIPRAVPLVLITILTNGESKATEATVKIALRNVHALNVSLKSPIPLEHSDTERTGSRGLRRVLLPYMITCATFVSQHPGLTSAARASTEATNRHRVTQHTNNFALAMTEVTAFRRGGCRDYRSLRCLRLSRHCCGTPSIPPPH